MNCAYRIILRLEVSICSRWFTPELLPLNNLMLLFTISKDYPKASVRTEPLTIDAAYEGLSVSSHIPAAIPITYLNPITTRGGKHI
jgi:hypothetical protein